MIYDIKPMKKICYVDGRAFENFELSFEDTEEDRADVFSVYVKEADGCLHWVADFGEKKEAEKWARAMNQK
jgi:hypothetical protein